MKPELDPSKRTNKIPAQKEKGKCRWCQADVPKPRRSWCSDECVHEALMRSTPSYARSQVEKRDKGVCAECGLDTHQLENTIRRLGNLAKSGLDAYDRTTNKASRRYNVPRNRLYQIVTAGSTDFEAALVEAKRADYTADQLRGLQSPWGRGYYSTPLPVTVPEQRIRTVHRRLMKLARARLDALCSELLKRGFDGVNVRWGSVDRSLWDADHIVPVVKGGGGCGLENYRTLCQPCHKAHTKALAARRALERRGIDPDAPPAQPSLF